MCSQRMLESARRFWEVGVACRLQKSVFEGPWNSSLCLYGLAHWTLPCDPGSIHLIHLGILRAHHWRPRKFLRRLLTSLEKMAYNVTYTGWPQCQAELSACYCRYSLSYKCRSCLKPFGPKLNVISQKHSWANTQCWSCKQTELIIQQMKGAVYLESLIYVSESSSKNEGFSIYLHLWMMTLFLKREQNASAVKYNKIPPPLRDERSGISTLQKQIINGPDKPSTKSR